MRRLLIALMLLTVLAGACSGGGDSDDSGLETSAGAVEGSAQGAADGDANGRAGAAVAPGEAADEEAAEPGTAEGGGIGEGGVALPVTISATDRIIKVGTMSLKVAEGDFDAAFGRVVDIAQRLGGAVADTQTSVTDDGYTSGSLTVRVPVESYEQLLVGIGEIGEVTHRSITSEDVSAEFVDLEARRRQLHVQEEFYLGLLADTTDVQSAIAVRGELDRIQADIERITGRLNLLEDRTAFSTLTVELLEPGAPALAGTPTRGLARYWEMGLDALVAAVGTMLVVALGVLPLAALIAIVLLVIRAVRRRPERPPLSTT